MTQEFQSKFLARKEIGKKIFDFSLLVTIEVFKKSDLGEIEKYKYGFENLVRKERERRTTNLVHKFLGSLPSDPHFVGLRPPECQPSASKGAQSAQGPNF